MPKHQCPDGQACKWFDPRIGNADPLYDGCIRECARGQDSEVRRLHTRIAELEAERDRLQQRNAELSRLGIELANSVIDQSSGALRQMHEAVVRPAARTDTDCCNQPDQCWEPCGDLGKSEAHAEPTDTEDE